LHTATFRQPLGGLSAAHAGAFDLGPVERPGDEHCPNNTRFGDDCRQIHGATYRHLFDLADWDKALATSAPARAGQHPRPHYGAPPVATVNGVAISRAELDAVLKAGEPEAVPQPAAQRRQRQVEALALLIDGVLMRQYLDKHAPPVSPEELSRRLAEMKTGLE